MKLDCVLRGSPGIRAKPPKRRPPLQYDEKLQEAGKQRVEEAAISKAAANGMTQEEGIKPSPRLPSRYPIVQYYKPPSESQGENLRNPQRCPKLTALAREQAHVDEIDSDTYRRDLCAHA